MKVKNIGNKIINFGALTLLPGESNTLPKEFENCPVLDTYVEHDRITIIKETPKTDDSKVAVPKNLDSLKKDALIALCEDLGITVEDDDTKAILIEKITEATAE